MAELTITFTKRRDGSVVTRFERVDGTATWQRKDGPQARFFAAHDLTHYAVETTRGYRRGFYGLIAEGYDLHDTSAPWPREQDPVEVIVGFLDRERASGERWPAAQFNDEAALYYSARGLADPPRLDDETLERMRETAEGLWRQWAQAPEGGSMVLTFTRKAVG